MAEEVFYQGCNLIKFVYIVSSPRSSESNRLYIE